jgi:aconitate hydratase
VVIAAITSCTNTSNPAVMIAAGLLAKNAVARGLSTRPWVKTSLAPGSKVVTDYLNRAELTTPLETLGFNLVGYGCTTCIGNSGPLPEDVAKDVEEHDLVVAAVLSGNRNFEGRIHPTVRANYLTSPPLVVAYAIAGRMDIDLSSEPLGEGSDGQPVYLRDIWPSRASIEQAMAASVSPKAFEEVYRDVFKGEERWASLQVPQSDAFAWDDQSTYVKHPPYFEGMTRELPPSQPIVAARALAFLGDSITTDHISPAGSIKVNGPAGTYLREHGVAPHDFNSYGSRRGNHEVMVRGTFANVRLRNRLAPGTEGGITRHFPKDSGEPETMSIYDAAMRYRDEGVPLVVIAGSDYGSGSSRDWAAKGPMLLGVRAVIAKSYERIHRSNLVGMGILPLQFLDGDDADRLGLTGTESFDLEGIDAAVTRAGTGEGTTVRVCARRDDGARIEFATRVRIDTPQEVRYYQHGGILKYVLRQLLARA